MALRVGLLGLPGAGRSTLFRLLTGAAPRADRSGVARGVWMLPDPNVEALARLYRPKRTRGVEVECLLVPPVAEGPRGRAWREAAEEAEVLLLCVRAFADPAVYHPRGRVDPAADARFLEEELLLADLALVETRLKRLAKDIPRLRDPRLEHEQALLQRVQAHLEGGEPLRTLNWDADLERTLKSLGFLSRRPAVLVWNRDEEGPLPPPGALRGGPAVPVAARLELELQALAPEEAAPFRREWGLEPPAAEALARAVLAAAGEVVFYTVVGREVRAWTVPKGSTAVRAAGRIHSDMERGFIRAEVARVEGLRQCRSPEEARTRGLWHLRGRDYVVQEGDVLEIRFSV